VLYDDINDYKMIIIMKIASYLSKEGADTFLKAFMTSTP
jgi:hypothetical protein